MTDREIYKEFRAGENDSYKIGVGYRRGRKWLEIGLSSSRVHVLPFEDIDSLIHKQLWSAEFIRPAVFTFTERADRWYTYGSLRYPTSGDGGYAAPNIT